MFPYEKSPASNEEILFVLRKLELLKGIALGEERLATLINTLIARKYSRAMLLDAYETIIASTTYNNLTSDMFLNDAVRDMMIFDRRISALVSTLIQSYEHGNDADLARQYRIDDLVKAKNEFLDWRKAQWDAVTAEFIASIRIDNAKIEAMERQLRKIATKEVGKFIEDLKTKYTL